MRSAVLRRSPLATPCNQSNLSYQELFPQCFGTSHSDGVVILDRAPTDTNSSHYFAFAIS